MAPSPQTLFHQRFCKASDCRALFFICSHCDRGQSYCSPSCRSLSRLKQLRAARRRHQQSPEGRLDHRDRQRAYRLRKSASVRASTSKSVTDHTSQTGRPSATISTPSKWLKEPVGSASWRLPQALFPFGLIVCQVCGRLGRFLNPFHQPG